MVFNMNLQYLFLRVPDFCFWKRFGRWNGCWASCCRRWVCGIHRVTCRRIGVISNIGKPSWIGKRKHKIQRINKLLLKLAPWNRVLDWRKIYSLLIRLVLWNTLFIFMHMSPFIDFEKWILWVPYKKENSPFFFGLLGNNFLFYNLFACIILKCKNPPPTT